MRKFQPYLHVNQHNIKANAKNGTDLPVLTCKLTSKGQEYAHEAAVLDKNGEVCGYFRTNGNPKSCGARVWFEPLYGVELIHREAE